MGIFPDSLSCDIQDDQHTEIPLLITPATFQSGVTRLFLPSLPALCGWGRFHFTRGQLLRLQTNGEPGLPPTVLP